MKVLFVIAVGIAVGIAIELLLARRQRARQVVLDPPDLPEGLVDDRPGRRDRRRTGPAASETTVVFDDEGGFRILGPVEYDDALAAPWESSDGERDADH